jgi:uncharacterized membrane protein
MRNTCGLSDEAGLSHKYMTQERSPDIVPAGGESELGGRMDGYELMKTLHVLAAVVWVGGAATVQVLAFRIQRQDDPLRLAAFSKDIEWVGTRVYTPASILVLLLGIGMVVDAYEFSDLWIVLALVGIVLSIVIGAGYLGPASGKLSKLIEERGAEDAEAQKTLATILMVSRIDLTILLLIVIDMVVKPGL